MAERSPTPNALRLRENFVWSLLGTTALAGCNWLQFVAIIRYFDDPSIVGRYALGLAVSLPLLALTNLELRSVLSTDSRETRPFSEYLTLRLVGCGAALLLAPLIAAMFYPDALLVISLVAAVRAVEALSDIFHGLYQRHERLERFAASQGTRSVLGLAAFVVALSLWGDLIRALLAQLVVALLVVALLEPRLARGLRPSGVSEAPGVRSLLVLAAPLGLVVFLGVLQLHLPRFFIEAVLGEYALGLFAAIASLVAVGTMVANALGHAVVPRLANHFADGNFSAFSALVWRLLGVALALGAAGLLGTWLLGEWLLGVAYDSEYAEWVNLLAVLCIFAGLNYMTGYLGAAITAMREFKVQVVTQAVRLLVVGLLCWALISPYGLMGAAWALVISQAFSAFLYYQIARWYLGRAQVASEAGMSIKRGGL